MYSRSRFVLTALASLAIVVVTAGAAAADTITLGWNANSELSVVGYMLHVGNQSGSYTQHIDVGFTTSYGWTGAVAGQWYCFALSAYASGHVEGPRSNEVCGYSNAAPTLVNPGSRSTVLGQATSLQLQGSDPDGQPVSYTTSGMPPGLSVMVGTGFISGTPTTAGTFTVTATVSDGVLTASQTFTWTITTSTGDTTPPLVTITGPTSAAAYTTTSSTLGLSGTASDNVGVTQITWANDRGGSGTASGTTSWSIGSIALATGTNVLAITARDAAGNIATDSITVTYSTTTVAGVTGGTAGTGLTAEYFNGGAPLQGLVMTRVDPTVNFNWGTGSPGSGVPAEYFSARWSGSIVAPVTGNYTFSTLADDAVRLYINDQLILDSWLVHTSVTTTTSQAVALQAGQRYAIRLEYYETTGQAVAVLQWTYPGQATQVVPQSVLFPSASSVTGGTAGTVAGTGLTAEYFTGSSPLQGLALTRVDPTVNFNWGSGSPASIVPPDYFSVRWSGEFVAPVTGTYTFSTMADDAVRLWVNNQQVISDWTVHTSSTVDTSAGVSLVGGQRYPIRLEYYEAAGQAVAMLLWSYPGQSMQTIPQSALFPTVGAPAPAPAPAPTVSGVGLRGDYFKGFTFDTTPIMTRVDPFVNFFWGYDSPTPLMTADSFLVRWTGTITAPVTGTYVFSTLSDDGVRLWVNNQQLINDWTDHAEATDTSVGVVLQAGQQYQIRLEYYESGGLATIQLRWVVPGQTMQVIPQSVLNP